jgi:methionyl-tRNA synthetase
MKRLIYVATAWPYANGSLHLGHASSFLGADIIARFHRMNGNKVLFVSGSDCHGTPVTLAADKANVYPMKVAEKYHKEFEKSLIDGLGFTYDLWTKTTTKNHEQVAQDIFLKLYNKGYIYLKSQELPYCEQCQRFLPDRYIEGECPICHYEKARGDQCDECGSILESYQLINPRCKLCDGSPIWKTTKNFFFKLTAFQDRLYQWVSKQKRWRTNAKQFTLNWLKQGLIDRAITRDITWGIPIPLKGYEDKRLYVWFEAVMGYLSASKEYSNKIGEPDYWKNFWLNEKAESYYVHAKDNIPFHTIIWPAILMAYGDLHLPDVIVSSEYLTLEGKQFSTSRNWGVWVPEFLKYFQADTLRYYLVINGPESADADFSWDQFKIRVNNELIGNLGNFVNRVFSMIYKNFPNGVESKLDFDNKNNEIFDYLKFSFCDIGDKIDTVNFKAGLKKIFKIIDKGNKYINDTAPWDSLKRDRNQAENDLAVLAYFIWCIGILLMPYLPFTSKKIFKMMDKDFKDLQWKLPNMEKIKITSLEPLFKKIEEDDIKHQKSLLG